MRMLGAAPPPEWPQADLYDVLPLQAAALPTEERFGIWVMIERELKQVVGDIGFLGPPTDGRMEIGYSVVPERRRCGYATESAVALVDWALRQPGVRTVVAGCAKDNVASIRTLERIGFSRTGAEDGQLRWQIAR